MKETSIYSIANHIQTIVTIGTFDGVHIGHQKIIKKLKKAALQKNAKATVLTFFPHPRMVLQQDNSIRLIHTMREKAQILEKIGLDMLVVHPFTKEFSRLTALEFVKQFLVEGLHAKKVIIGYDHRFGRNRTADITDLKTFGTQYDFEVEEISAQEINEVSVSSTKIRKALHNGDIQTANKYLGHPFLLTGKVIAGKKIGRTLGFATANIHIEEPYKLIPKNGVYAVMVIHNKKRYQGMLNIGTNPTVQGNTQSIEVHIFDFNKEIYQQEIQLELLHYLREEQKFDSLEELTLQLHKDKQNTLHFFSLA